MRIRCGALSSFATLFLLISSESYAQAVPLQFYRPLEIMYEIVMPCTASAKLRELARESGLLAEEIVDYDDLVTFQIRAYGPPGILDEDGQAYAALFVYIREDRAIAKQYVFSYGYIKGPLVGQKEYLSDKLKDWGYYKCFPSRAP